MGAYLSTPNTEKISSDDSYDHFDCGVSGMQGWRMSMEDAHCCLANVDDKDSALFGVFDGHGGKEVAEYCAQNFHKFLLDNECYQEGKIKPALMETFMTIDEALTSPEVIKELKEIGGFNENDNEEEEDDEAAMLLEEANMPLHELLQKFKGNIKDQLQKNGILRESDEDEESDMEEEKSTVMKEQKERKEENIVNGHDEIVKDSSRSRKQKKPVKRNAEQEVPTAITPHTTDTDPSNNSGSSSGAGGSSSTTTNTDGGESSSSITEAAGSSSGTAASSMEPGPSSGSSNVKDTAQPDDDPDYEGEDTEENEDHDAEEEEEESETESEDEFEDAEGVDFQPGSEEVGKDSGTTAIIALIHKNKLYVGNVGDSRCVLCRNGAALDMSIDHKPEDESERTRIEKAGGKITMDGRVNGGLNLSRAIGDHTYKQNKDLPPEAQLISPLPDVQDVDITPNDDFMVLACDGIWNMMTSEEVIDFVKDRMSENEKPCLSKICEEIFDHCLAPDTDNDGSGCDNMTCLIVRFKHDAEGKTSIQTASKKRTLDGDNENTSKKAKLSSLD